MRDTSRSGPISGLIPLADEPRRLPLATVHWSLLLLALLLAAVGLVTVASASAEMAVDYLPRQAVRVAVGVALGLLALAVDYRRLATFAVPAYGASLLLLGVVLVAGQEGGGARSWLALGSAQLQPAELAKLTTALLLAVYLAGAERDHLQLKELAGAVGIVAAPMALIAPQPDLGGAATFLPLLGGVLLVAGVRLRIVVGALALALAVGGTVWTVGMQPYQRDRILTFVSPGRDPLGAGYQLRQSKIAVGSGQLLGKGYRQGTQSQLRFLPARHTDFIFAVLAEEWGFLGVALVLGLYAAYVSAAAAVAARARDRLGILLVVALLSVFAFHVLYNTAMVIGLVPITGIPLPFLSYGGSFTLFNFVATGLILGVDLRRHVNR